MSMLGRPGKAVETGETVASFRDYESAQKAVSKLIAADVPARDIAIVGTTLRSVEKVTGRLGYAAAARSGAINGVLIGLFFSAILVLGTPSVPIQAFVGVIFLGIAVGMVMSLVTYAFVRRRRDFASVMQVTADHYEVTVLAASIHRARQTLGPESTAPPAPGAEAVPPAPAAGAVPDSAPVAEEPPRYGVRLPTGPEAPSVPEAPAGPASPADPEAPAGPAAPADPEAPADPADPESNGEPPPPDETASGRDDGSAGGAGRAP